MDNLDAELAYFVRRAGQSFKSQISDGTPLPEGAIAAMVTEGPFPLDDEQKAWLTRQLEQSFTTTQKRGAAIIAEFKPWLQERRGDIDFYYWNRLQRYYLEGSVIPPHVVATLDAVTDEILDFSGDPVNGGVGLRRGMVMGHVQSGKTTNYSALICKAADAGYKTIILLAGITNTLRSQTQERLDETFIGKKSVFNALVNEPLPLLSYATTAKRFPAYGTSRDRDFTRDKVDFFFGIEAHKEPIIFVIKKNKAPLTRLRDWLKEQMHGEPIASPLLLIDDEADNASINTSTDPKATTVINGVIREILGLFDRRSYVGYTATPFANIFIDPDTKADMVDDDLFPKHFIKALDPPSNYVGAARVFAPDGDLRPSTVTQVADYESILPLRHKADVALTELPPTLRSAVRVFVLSRAIRILRGQGRAHCSMMINVSRFNAVQERVHGLIYAYLAEIKNSALVSSALPDPMTDPVIADLRADFEEEFGDSGSAFGDVLGVLREATQSITTVVVNMKGGTLDYSRHKVDGLHVIAIGGLALSRGLTLEGLTVSYILRNTAASDTLMQMARWFGYRPDYEDLCRVYLPRESLEHYENIHEAIEELRDEVRRMQALGLTPEHFGLKVRESDTAIRITAANKMRTAKEITLAQDYSNRHIEGYVLANDSNINSKNIDALRTFLARLPAPESDDGRALVWTGVTGAEVMTLLRGFYFPAAHLDLGAIGSGGSSLLIDYVGDRLSGELRDWDIALPHLKTGQANSAGIIPGHAVALRQRLSGVVDDSGAAFRVTGGKNRVADPNDAQIGLDADQLLAGQAVKQSGRLRGDKAFCAQRTRPLLLIHIFTTGATKKLDINGPVASLSFCLPSTKIAPETRTYQVNTVYQRQIQAEADSEAEDDEAMLQEEDNVA